MRVAHLTTVDTSLRYLLFPQLLAVLADGGEVVGISAPGKWVGELTEAGVSHRPLPSSTRGMNPLADLKAARELWRVLRSEHFDVLHTHNPKPGLYGRVVGRLAGVPIVVHTTHGLFATTEDRWSKRALVYLAEALASRFSDAELVQNPEDLALMNHLRLVPRRRAFLLGNGVDLSRFHPDGPAGDRRAALRAELGAGPDQVVVGTVGRLVGEKGYPELFHAAELLGDRYLVVAIGPDDPDKSDALSGQLIEQARNLGVRFLGMRLDVEGLYAAMDVFVLASHREGLPRAAMEAAAMGLPAVVTDVRGCRQVVDRGVTGLLVPVRDPPALAEAIRRLGEDAELRREMGAAARQRASRYFDERRVVAKVMATYEEVARRKGVGASLIPPLNRPRRVLWLAKGLGFGGSEQLLVNAVPHLDRTRFTVEVAYLLPWKDGLVPALEDQDVPVHCLGGGHPLDLRWVARLRALVETGKFDLVHTHMPHPAIGARLALGSRVTLVHTEHNVWDRYRRPTAWGNALTWGRNRVVIAVSESVASSIRPLPLGPSPRVEVVVQGIDVAAAQHGPAARAEARVLLDLGADDPVVGTVGNFTAKKDQGMLLTAFAAVLASHPTARLVLVGSGPLEHALRAQAIRLGIGGQVCFTGVRSDVLRLLPAFDVFALSSRFEGLPISLLEALASGLACVATTAGGIPEVIEDGREGFLVAPGDVAAMAGRLVQLIEDPALRAALGRAAASRGAGYDIGPAVHRLQDLYDEALSGTLTWAAGGR
ncbi:hypothetical protein BH24ACT1_BH24ACT1_11310 [soil metagenome]